MAKHSTPEVELSGRIPTSRITIVRKRASRFPSATLRAALHERYGDACAFCGETTVPLEIASVIPFHEETSVNSRTATLLCPNCHRKFDDYDPKEAEFTDYLCQILRANADFRNIAVGAKLPGKPIYIADITAERRDNDVWKALLIECKNRSSFSETQITGVLTQLKQYGARANSSQLTLVIPSRLLAKDREIFEKANIEIWDLDFIANTFQAQIEVTPHPYYQILFSAVAKKPPEDPYQILIKRLKACPSGREEWAVYQKLIGEIFSELFTPPLEASITELADLSGVNRRDFVFPNYAETGFWKFLRGRYNADYIVIDAKNYARPISKHQALQILNYLKPHGTGLFAIIISRLGADFSCLHTIREHWIAQQKMIVVLSDRDVEQMLLAASSRGKPEQVIGRWIQEFRLGL